MSERLRFKDGSLAFRLDGYLMKTGKQPPYALNFSSNDVEGLVDSFFEWLKANDLEFGGVFGTVMEDPSND